MKELRQLLKEAHFTVPRIRKMEKQAGRFKIAVVGDFYLDRYVVGEMAAISREAPVPIVRVQRDTYSPGAAGNIAVNLRTLGCDVSLLGIVGKDLPGRILLDRFHEKGVRTEFLLRLEDWETPNFNKIYATVPGGLPQQVARFDKEPRLLRTGNVQERISAKLRGLFPSLDAVVLADYSEAAGRGWLTLEFVQDVIRLSGKFGVPAFATSRKRGHWLKGSRVVVLNEVEMLQLLGFIEQTLGETGGSFETNVHKVASFLGTEQLFLTVGDRGIVVASPGAALLRVPTLPQHGAIDVTGAGDGALAAIVVATLLGLGPKEAALLANFCAGVIIRKTAATGSATVEEIIAEIHRWRRALNGPGD